MDRIYSEFLSDENYYNDKKQLVNFFWVLIHVGSQDLIKSHVSYFMKIFLANLDSLSWNEKNRILAISYSNPWIDQVEFYSEQKKQLTSLICDSFLKTLQSETPNYQDLIDTLNFCWEHKIEDQ